MYKVGSIEISVHYARTNKPYEIYYVLYKYDLENSGAEFSHVHIFSREATRKYTLIYYDEH